MTPPSSPFDNFFEMFEIQILISIKIKISIVNSWGMLLLEGRLERQERRVVSAILGKSGWATLTFFLTQPLFPLLFLWTLCSWPFWVLVILVYSIYGIVYSWNNFQIKTNEPEVSKQQCSLKHFINVANGKNYTEPIQNWGKYVQFQ